MRPTTRLLLVIAGLMTLSVGLTVRAEDDAWAVEAGGNQLKRAADFPWYDAEKDSLRRVDVEPPADVAGRKSKWNPRPWNWSMPDWVGTLLEAIGWTLLVLVILGVVYALAKAFVADGWLPGSSRESSDELVRGDIDRIESLPFQIQRPQSDLLAEARRYYEAGEYGKAIVYLYSYQLIQLDKHQLIRLAKGKTNRQYLREMRPSRDLWQLLQRSMLAFEDVFFGHHTLERDRFEVCWRGLDDFHKQLQQFAV